MTDLFTPVDIQDQQETPSEITALVGPDKKYKTEADLVKAVFEKDRFINQLQSETAGLRAEVQQKITMDELLTKVRESTTAPQNSQPQAPAPDQTPNYEALVAELLEKKEKERKTLSNKQTVERKLLEKYGADAQLHLNKKAKELNVPLEYLAKIANESPDVFFSVIGLNDQSTGTPFGAPRSTAQLQNQNSGKRDKKYYDELKKRDPRGYWEPKVQTQMHKDAILLGQEFFN